ncbi:lysozyme inhibitor LprI family protein [Mesorhizobium atlanticum]
MGLIAAIVSTYDGTSAGLLQTEGRSCRARPRSFRARWRSRFSQSLPGCFSPHPRPARQPLTARRRRLRADLAICRTANAASADAGLNAVYKALAARLAPADLKRLRDAQRAWIPFRDKECAFRTQLLCRWLGLFDPGRDLQGGADQGAPGAVAAPVAMPGRRSLLRAAKRRQCRACDSWRRAFCG